MDLVSTWQGFEEAFLAYDYNGIGLPDHVREVIGRTVLWAAPHSVNHVKADGSPRPADSGTGGLALLLADQAGHSALVATGRRTRPDISAAPLVGALERLRLPCVDLHTMHDGHGIDVCLGRGPNPRLANDLVGRLEASLSKAGLVVGIDDPFPATTPNTLTRYLQERRRPALQVEVSRAWRSFSDPEHANILVGALLAAFV